MKKIDLLLLAIIAISLFGCSKIADINSDGSYSPKYYQYFFAVNIKDAAGNDLVLPFQDMKPPVVGTKPEGYTLDVLVSPYPELNNESYLPYFVVTSIEDDYYLYHDLTYFQRNGKADKIVYQITFPDIFGDGLNHEIETFWGNDPRLSPDKEHYSLKPECTKAVFDGKELDLKKLARFSTSREGNYYIYYVDIVLDK
ncbi:MAG: hypothetical protein K6G53_07275 [Bacteroidales bacterium]|nr:hypothetical protein [Bacteroidales bacterium]